MKLFAWKFSLVVIHFNAFGGLVSANQHGLEYYSPSALLTQTFASFDSDYLGGRGFFQPTALAEEYLRADAKGLRSEIHTKVDEAMPFWSALVPGTERLREKTLAYIDREFERQQRNWYVGGVWGIAVANSANDPSGPDDLFIAVDHKYGSPSFLDFGHPFTFELTDAQEDLAAKLMDVFDIDLDDIMIPTVGAYSTPYSDNGLGSAPFKDPRGICTDRRGDFWIADHGNDRVLCLGYSPEEQRFLYQGCITGVKFGKCSGLRQTEWPT